MELAHDLDSVMLYVHPPLAIAGHALVLMVLAQMVFMRDMVDYEKWRRRLVLGAWAMVAAGLVTGMVWSQVAFGVYWNWDPKEMWTLALFVSVCINVFLMERKDMEKWFTLSCLVSALIVLLTAGTRLLFATYH